MNHLRSRPPLLCSNARNDDPRRKPAQPLRCTADCHHVPQKYRWADAATSAQLTDTLPAHARARGVTLFKSSNLGFKDNPHVVTKGYQRVPSPVTAATLGHTVTIRLFRLAYTGARAAFAGLLDVRSGPALRASRITGLPGWACDLIFAANDREARWRGWDTQRRHAGLSRCYRDPRFDTLIRCSRCHGLGTTTARSSCAHCSGIGRIALDQPPFAHDG
jgi:hypothetical protein